MDEFQNENFTEKCIKWDEIEGIGNGILVTVSIDDDQFFINWKSSNGSSEYIETSLIRDIRLSHYAKIPKDRKILDLCTALSDENDNIVERCISICTGFDFVNITWLNFVSKTKEFAIKIYDIVLKEICSSKSRNPSRLLHLKKIWKKLSLDIQDQIEVSSFAKYFTQSKEDREKIQHVIKDVGVNSQTIRRNEFTFKLFLDIYEKLFFQDVLTNILEQLTSADTSLKNKISINDFAKFINQFQRDKRLNEILYPQMTNDKAKEVISKYESDPELVQQGMISTKGFIQYILSEDNSIIDPLNYELTQDMNHPLNHYFINSSHNSYLTGHQLTGKSSAEIYRQILISGGRCIELDIWDGKGMDDEPIVTHGFTMCTAVPLRDVIDAIDESAFKTSDFPVILSFENHCTSKQLPILVSIIQEKLSSKILKEPLDSHPLEPGVPLPSPEKLKGKILIKNKKKSNIKDVDLNNDPSDINEEDKTSEIIVPQISSMVNYVEPTSFESFEKASAKNLSFECCSFGEIFAIQSLNENPVSFVNFNKRQFSRIYPKGTRVDSSNFLPQLFWNSGCQLVALNFQTLDLGMQLNLGNFEFQNRCGYILKPVEMRSYDRDFDPFLESGVDGVVSNSLKITILSGHFISDKGLYCYVEVEMFGLPADTVRKRNKVKSTTKTGLNPQFLNSVILFQKIIHPQLALLRFVVSSEGSKFIGQAWIPVSQIRPGYRMITLRNESGQCLMMPSLLIHVEVEDYVPSDMEDFAMALSNPIAFLTEKERRAQQLEILTEDFNETDEKNYFNDAEVNTKLKIANVKSTPDDSTTSKPMANEETTETLSSKKKRQTIKLKQSFKKKSSLKRGKSVRSTIDNEEIAEFLNQSILKESSLSNLDLEKMKNYKGCFKIIEKKESALSALRKKYEKKKLILTKTESKDDDLKEIKNYQKESGQKSVTNSLDVDTSLSEKESSNIIQQKTSNSDKKSKDLQATININYENEVNSTNLKYTNLFYDELHSSLESDIHRFRQRIEKLYQKESEVLKSLQHYKFKCEMKYLQKECTTKDEFNRLKREALQKHIQSSVGELQKLTDLKEARLKDLEDNILIVSENFKTEKEKDLKNLI